MKNFIKGKEGDKMTKEDQAHVEPHPEQYEAETAEPAAVEKMFEDERDKKTDDAKLAAEWQKAAEAAPSEDDAASLRNLVAKTKASLESVEKDYATAVVARACVLGFKRVAEEESVTPKQIHAWRQRYAPDMPDLSAVPEKEMKREERRVKALDQRIAAEKEFRARREEHAKRLAKFQELTGKSKPAPKADQTKETSK